jgi:hypothetical protein
VVVAIKPEVSFGAIDPGRVAWGVFPSSRRRRLSADHRAIQRDPSLARFSTGGGVKCSLGAPRKPMNAQVSIRFGPDLTIEFSVPFASDAAAQVRAREWLERTYDEFGCVPTRPTGKVLLLDRILGIADAAGEKHFQRNPEWGNLYAQAVSSALDRIAVQVNVEERTVSS